MKTRIIQDEPDRPQRATVDSPVSAKPGGSGFRSFVRRHRLVTFFVLAYLIGWPMVPFGSFLAFAPLVAVLLVVSVADGLAGLRRLGARVIRWRVGWVWYAAAVAVPLLVHAAAIGTNMAAGAPAPSWSQYASWYSVLLVVAVRLVNPTDGPLGEEPGWRGFAQPRLQALRSPLVATGLLAVLITGWHLPLVFMSEFDLGPADILTTLAVTFWYAWLFNHTGGSVLLTLVAHSVEGSVDIARLWPDGADADRQRWTYLLAWAVLAVALVVFDRAAWRTAPESDEPADGPAHPRR